MANEIGNVAIRVNGDIKPLTKSLNRASGKLSRFSKSTRNAIPGVAKLGAAAAATGVALTTAFVVKGLKAVDANAKLARSIGATDKGMRALKISSNDAGVEWSVMSKAAEQLNKRLGEALSGTGEAAGALDRLGLSASNLIGMDVDERFAAIGQRVNELGWSTAKAGDMLRDFGIRNGEVVNLLNAGEGAFKGARQEVDELGLAISDIDAAKVEAANDSFSRIGMIIDSASEKLAVEFAPLIDAVSDQFTDMAKEAGGAGDAMSQAFDSTLSAAAFTADAFDSVGRVFETMADSIIIGLSALAREIAETIEGIMSMADMVPGVDLSGPLATVRGFAADMDGVTKEAGLNIKRNLEEPLAGSAFMARVQEAQEAAQAAAEAAAKSGDDDGDNKKKGKAVSGSDLKSLRDSVKSEIEIIEEKYGQERALLDQALQAEQITKQEWAEIAKEQKRNEQAEITEIEKSASDKRKQLAQQEADFKSKALGSALSDLSTLMNSESRKMFEIGKAGAYAQALVDGKAAVVGAYKNGASIGGPTLGAAYATAAGLATAAQIQQISSASFGSGGGGGNSVTQGINGGGQAVQSQEQAQTINRNVYVQTTGDGNNIPRDQLVSELNGALEEGYTLRGIS